MKLHYNHINLIFVMRFDKVLLFSKLTFSYLSCKEKKLMQLEKDSEPIGSKYLSSKAKKQFVQKFLPENVVHFFAVEVLPIIGPLQ